MEKMDVNAFTTDSSLLRANEIATGDDENSLFGVFEMICVVVTNQRSTGVGEVRESSLLE